MFLRGRVWKLGDNMKSGGEIIPTRYDHLGMSSKFDELAKHVFEDTVANFSANVTKGDLIVAGDNFGSGHAHFVVPAAKALMATGVAGCIAESFSGTFQRVAINAGFPAIEARGISSFVQNGDEVEIDLLTGQIRNFTQNSSFAATAAPQMIIDILNSGGFEQYAVKKLRSAA